MWQDFTTTHVSCCCQVVCRDYPRPALETSQPFREAQALSAELGSYQRPERALRVLIAGGGEGPALPCAKHCATCWLAGVQKAHNPVPLCVHNEVISCGQGPTTRPAATLLHRNCVIVQALLWQVLAR